MAKFRAGTGVAPVTKMMFVYYPTPGCILHDLPERKRDMLFNKYKNLSKKAALLYWRLHMDEYRKLIGGNCYWRTLK